MIVPQFWAEARLHRPRAEGQGQITVRRFGWSDTSQADAEQMAQQRVAEAFRLALDGGKIPRRELKLAYNGAAGLPIREEILARDGDSVITRNSYGAHCLNTPDVLFADIDFNREVGCGLIFGHFASLFAIVVIFSLKYHSRALFVFGTLAALVLAPFLAKLTHRITLALGPDPEQTIRQRLATFLRQHGDWHVRLYRSPAGFRALAMHRTFDPHAPEVADFFNALAVDRTYALMCKNQRCFRARVSPKPWRIGIGGHMKPRPGIWPVRAEALPQRSAWIEKYEAASTGFASCKFLDALGSRTIDPKAEAVRDLHDRLAKATSNLPIA